MKIAIPIYSFNKEGGIERHTYEVVKRWHEKHEIHLFCHEWQDFGWKNVHFHKVPALNSMLASPSFAIMSSLKIKKQEFDIIFNNGCGAAFTQDVITSASCHKAWANEMKKANLKKWFLNPLHYWTFFIEGYNYKNKRFKKVMAISEFIKKHLMNYYNISSRDIEVVHLGVNSEEFNPEFKNDFRKKIRVQYNIPDDKFIISFIGKEFKRKGLKYLMDAINSLNNSKVHLIVVGDGEIQLFKDYAARLGISKQVTFTGHKKELNEFYCASDSFIFPTTFDAFALVVLEAMACGLPVIVSKTAGASELIEHNVDGIILDDYKDSKILAEYIEYLINNNDSRNEMGVKAREKAMIYSWDRVSDKMMNIFREIHERKNKIQI